MNDQQQQQQPAKLTQGELLALWRGESVISRDVPLGYPSNNDRVEVGVPASVYYRRKHGRGGPGHGTYWPLHRHVGWDDRIR